jgi:hypothetical protein
MIFWNQNKQDILNGNNSKLDIYFSLKNCFDREKYTQINDFEIRQSLCKLIISVHLIKHMYTLNKLRVKVDNKLGQCFNSHIGVYPQGDVFQFIYR